jgi:predicted ATPase/DNA-binding XRE family transcriptional regulator
MNTSVSFGSWLRRRRKALDLTQAELADQVGCALTTIQKIEADIRRPSKQIAERFADVLAISLAERSDFVNFARRVIQPITLPNDLVASTTSHNLPPHATPFLGREPELIQIAERLADPNCRLLTIIGLGGTGKTRLAVQAAANRLDDFEDGVYFVSLAPVGSAALIATAIANVLQVSFYGQEDTNTQVVNYLRGKHMLLVVDNCEHLLDGIGWLTDMLASAPRLKILATSRERLNLHEEWVLPLGGLPFPMHRTNDLLDDYSAIQLFVQTARRLQSAFSLEGHENAVIEICQAAEGMPLGIELAATWLRAMPCDQIAEQIRRDLDFLATPLRNVPDRHRSLRSVFDHSWQLLTDSERNVLMKFSVFCGGIAIDAAEVVAQAPLWLLADLVDKSLVRLNADGRYEMHELLRQFAADKLEESNSTAEVKQQHLHYVLGLAEQLEKRLFGPQQLAALDRLEKEHDNFRAALRWALQAGEAELGLRLAGALGWFWNRRTFWSEGSEWFEKLLAMHSEVATLVRAKAVHHYLELAYESRKLDRLATLYAEGVELLNVVDSAWHIAWLMCSLGFVEHRLPLQSCIPLEDALALFQTLGDQWGICETMARMSGIESHFGEIEKACRLREEGIKLARQAGDKSVLSWMLWGLASCYSLVDQTDPRIEHLYWESLSLFQELGYKSGIHAVLCELGRIVHTRGQDAQAMTLFQQSIKLGQQMGDTGYYMLVALMDTADIFRMQGKLQRGTHLLAALHDQMQLQLSDSDRFDVLILADYARVVSATRKQLSDTVFAMVYAEGQMMTLDQAIEYALM